MKTEENPVPNLITQQIDQEPSAIWRAQPAGKRTTVLIQWLRLIGSRAVPALVGFGALIALWQWYAGQPSIDPQLLPTPVAVYRALAAELGLLWQQTLVTLEE